MELLKNLAPYILITRPKNLLIVGLTQFIIYYCLFNKFGNEVTLSGYLLYLFILDTILITASGYIINDVFDNKADAVNKPKKTYIPHAISINKALLYYFTILTVGLFLCVFIAIKLNHLPSMFLYILACGTLYLYSLRYKNTVLIGNVIVSLFVAFVPGIILFFEWLFIFQKPDLPSKIVVVQLLLFYIVFSFLVNLIREIIKDIEDKEGDQNEGIITLPIKYGIAIAKKWCISLAFLTILLLASWIILNNIPFDFTVQVYLLLFVAAPLVIIIQILTNTTVKRDFNKISTILKWVMLAGLGAIFLISKTI